MEKKDNAETIQVEDSSKAQEAESSKKGETDSTGSGNAPTEIVEDSPDKEHQKVAQLSDVQSPSEPSVSPVELEGKEIEKGAVTEAKLEVQSPQEVTAVKVEQEPTVKAEITEPVVEVKTIQESATETKAAAPEPVAEVKAAAPEPVSEVKAAAPEPVVEVKAAAPEPAAEVKAEVPEPIAVIKAEAPESVAAAPEPETKLDAPAAPEPITEVTAPIPVIESKTEVQQPTVEEKAEAPEPIIETKTELSQPAVETSKPVVEINSETPEVKPVIPEPVEETKAEPVNEETIVVEPITENFSIEAVAEQIVESTPEQVIEATKDLGSPVNEISIGEKPIETVVSENVPSEVDSTPVLETKVESPVTSNTQEENVTNSEIVPDKVGDTKDNQSPLQETISDTVSEESAQNASTPEGITSMQDDLKSEEFIPAPPPELIQNSNLIDDKLNSNAQEVTVITPQSPVDAHSVENETLNGHVEHQVNGIETQNGNVQETSTLVNGEVIGNGPKTEIATLISWKHGGQEVAVCGDFCNWGDNCTLALAENEGIFSTKIKLPKGQHHIKFFVDGQWTVDENAPIVELEGHGQVNLVVVAEGSD